MRKILSFLFPLALSFSGCNLEDIQDQQLNLQEERIFTASFEQNETRTYVENGNLLRWNASDQISLFDGNTLNRQYQFDGETGDNSGTFSIVNAPYGSGNDLNANYAVYPYASDIKITEAGVITLTVPAEQNFAENSFGLGANTMVAVTENHDDTFLKFKNVGGYLKLQLYGDDVTVKSIELTGNSNEKIAGKASITPTYSDEPKISMSNDATSSITLNCGEGVSIGSTAENATAFWIVVPPTTFENGFTITITDIKGETFTKATSNEIAIERNVIKPMKSFEVIFENETEDEGSSNDYIDEYGKNHGAGIEIDGTIWAPVNCGYHETDFPWGKLYQWGRKYGQGYTDNKYADSSYPAIDNGTILFGGTSLTNAQSESNQNKFYLGDSSNDYDWLTKGNSSKVLWNTGTEEEPVKNHENDPCPNGWRVPTYGELKSLQKNYSQWLTNDLNHGGIWLSGSNVYTANASQIFLDAAGGHTGSSGLSTSEGTYSDRNNTGRYWSSYSPFDSRASSLLFYNKYGSFSISMNTQYKSNGYSIRCVHE